MKRVNAAIGLTLALSFAAAGTAFAQVAPGGGGPLPGSGDSGKITNTNRENNAAYNRLIGASDAKAQTATGDKAAKPAAKAVKATAADIHAGAALRAVDGPQIGTIVSVNGDQVIVDTGASKIGVPLIGFGKDEKGLVLSMTAAKFNEAVAKAHAAHAAAGAAPKN